MRCPTIAVMCERELFMVVDALDIVARNAILSARLLPQLKDLHSDRSSDAAQLSYKHLGQVGRSRTALALKA